MASIVCGDASDYGNMFHMSNAGSPNARALYAFLEEEWDAMGTRPTAWCRKVGLADATIFRWRDEGAEPDMRTLKKVADALERPLVDVLIKAKYITPDDVGGYEAPPRTYDLLETIRLDTALSDGEREALRQVHDAFQMVQQGKARTVKVRGRGKIER